MSSEKTSAVIHKMPTAKAAIRNAVQTELNGLIGEILTYYEGYSGLIDDLNRQGGGKGGIRQAQMQIEWLKSELEAYKELEAQET